jgi:hypothetical protein
LGRRGAIAARQSKGRRSAAHLGLRRHRAGERIQPHLDGIDPVETDGTRDHLFFRGAANVTTEITVAPSERVPPSGLHKAFFYLGLFSAKTTFEVDLDDGSEALPPRFEQSGGALDVAFQVNFRTPPAGKRIRARWTLVSGGRPESAIRIVAASLRQAQ